jgi:hypothetical protein
MTRTPRLRRTHRLLAPLLLVSVIGLAGCSSDDSEPSGGSESSSEGSEGADDSAESEGSGAAEGQVSALGIGFVPPEGWEELAAEDANIPDAEAEELAGGLGLTPEQFQQTVQSVDLFVVDGEGPQDGFLSNINVLGQTGALPPQDQLEQQFAGIGAQEVAVSTEDSEVGEITAVEYSLAVQDNTVEGVSYLFARDDEVVTITVSTPDRAQTEEIGAQILDTLVEAG